MRVLLFGSGGQLGSAFVMQLPAGWDVSALDFPDVDLADRDSIHGALEHRHPDLVINCAAYTAVDRAESEPELAAAVNTQAPGVIGELAAAKRSAVLHFSTDYVFNGRKGSPYLETDTPDPLNVYGRTKLEGERLLASATPAAITLRTSWVYGPGGGTFPDKVLAWAHSREELHVVDDQVSGPTSAAALARASLEILKQAEPDPWFYFQEHGGVYHLAGEPPVSRLEWAQAVLALDPARERQRCEVILPAATSDFPTAAARPLYSGLDCGLARQTFGLAPLAWRADLEQAYQKKGGQGAGKGSP